MKLRYRTGLERAQLFLVDQVIADETMLRPVAKLHVESERLEELVALQRREEVTDAAIALVQLIETGDHCFEIFRRPSVIIEGTDPFIARTCDARVIEVDVHLCFLARCRSPNEKRLNGERKRAIARGPLSILDEQIFSVLEPEQCERRELPAIEVAPEKDREFVLDTAELGRDGKAGHHPVSEFRRYARTHAHVAMDVAVENDVPGHACTALSRGTRIIAIELSSARLVGSAASRPRVRSRTCPNWRRVASLALGSRSGSAPPMP